MMSNTVSKSVSEVEGQHYRIAGIPKPFESFSFNSDDLTTLLAHLDSRLGVLEDTPITPSQFPYQAYAEAKVFLKACYLFFSILLDDVAGIIEYFYKKNAPGVGVKKKFGDLLRKAERDELHSRELCELLKGASLWFPELTRRRDDLVHKYETLLISFEHNQDGKRIVGQFSTKESPTIDCGDIREYFGFVLCEYYKFVDKLLGHLDEQFEVWYGIVQREASRTTSVIEGTAGIMLWWAYKYGDYNHKDLVVIESD